MNKDTTICSIYVTWFINLAMPRNNFFLLFGGNIQFILGLQEYMIYIKGIPHPKTLGLIRYTALSSTIRCKIHKLYVTHLI